MPELILMRGIPGSGKSTWAKAHSEKHGHVVLSTDDYWMHPPVPYWFMPKDDIQREYRFDAKLLKIAHNWNRERVEGAMHDKRDVIVDNTNLDSFSVAPYFDLALKHGYVLRVQNMESESSAYHLSKALKYNATRTPDRRIPEGVIRRMHEKCEAIEINVYREHENARVRKLEADIATLKATLSDAQSVLTEVMEYLEDRYDVCDGDDGEPRPNTAMSLGGQIERVLEGMEKLA